MSAAAVRPDGRGERTDRTAGSGAALLARNVRNGRPMGIAGLPDMAKGAGFATVAGMIIYPQICSHEYIEPRVARNSPGLTATFRASGIGSERASEEAARLASSAAPTASAGVRRIQHRVNRSAAQVGVSPRC